MIRNYFLTAVRSFVRHWVHGVLGILGLGVAVGCVMLIGLFVVDEWGFNRMHPDAENTYRVVRTVLRPDGSIRYGRGTTSGKLAGVILSDVPGVKSVVRTQRRGMWVGHQDKTFMQTLCMADEGIFDLFHLPFVIGNAQSVVREPGGVLVTQTLARKLFGDADPIGKMLSIQEANPGADSRVVGVLKDLPRQSTMRFDLLVFGKTATKAHSFWNNWVPEGSRKIETWVRLSGVPDANLIGNLTNLIGRYMGPDIAKTNGYDLQRLSDIYLYPGAYPIGASPGNIGDLYLIGSIGLLILVLAAINFVTLSIARSADRMREIGLRKVVGAQRRQLQYQFLTESIFYAVLSLPVGLCTAWIATPLFRELVNRDLPLLSELVGPLGFVLVLGVLVLGVLTGAYPALILSAVDPALGIKNKSMIKSSGGVQRVLIVFQFAVTVVLICVATVVALQLDYTQTADLGFKQDQVVVLPLFWNARSTDEGNAHLLARYQDIKQVFANHPDVLDVCVTRFRLGQNFEQSQIKVTNRPGEQWRFSEFWIDGSGVDFFGLQMLDGRPFPEGYPTFTTEPAEQIILNETAVKLLGWSDPIGKQIIRRGKLGTVIGVVKDFHYANLRYRIGPLMIISGMSFKYINVRVREGKLKETLSFFEAKWKDYLPSRPFEWFLLDDFITASNYRQEIQSYRIYKTFSLVAIIIATLGLFSLAASAAQRRQREVGIRKVLGASVARIASLLVRDFVVLVGVANLIAIPIAYYFMSDWLNTFAFHFELGPAVFLMIMGATLCLAIVTVGGLAVRAALVNPVDTLRRE